MMNTASGKLLRAAMAGTAILVAAIGGAAAQEFPNKPVRMIVPFPPGSATDLAARIIGQQLGSALGQPFVVENKPGAGGSIAGSEVVRAAPDGHTLMFSSNSAVASNVALLKNIPYEPLKDFTPVAGVAQTMLVLMVKPDFPAGDLREFIAAAKQKQQRGQLSAGYGSSSSQISISLLDKLAGTETLAVPYKGIPLALVDVIGGTLDYSFADLGNALAQSKGAALKAIAVTSPERNPLAPDWPALAEVLPGYDITAWFAIVGPAAMPTPVVEKLNDEVTKLLGQPEVRDKLASIGLTPMPMSAARLREFIGAEITKWQRLAKDANIQPQ